MSTSISLFYRHIFFLMDPVKVIMSSCVQLAAFYIYFQELIHFRLIIIIVINIGLDPKNFDCLQWFLRELRHSSHAFILASILFSSFIIIIIIFIVIMVKPKTNLLIKVRQRICGEIVN